MTHFLPPERKRLFLYFKEKRKSETILWKLLTIEHLKNKAVLPQIHLFYSFEV